MRTTKKVGIVLIFVLILTVLTASLITAKAWDSSDYPDWSPASEYEADWEELSFTDSYYDVTLYVDRDYMSEVGHTWGDISSSLHSSSHNKVSIDTDTFPELNVPAEITFKNICYDNPIILHNGIMYDEVTVTKSGLCDYTFIAPYWSEWTIVENDWNGTHYQTTVFEDGLVLDYMSVGMWHFTNDSTYQEDETPFDNDFDSTDFTWVPYGYSGGGVFLNGTTSISVNNNTELTSDLEDSFTIISWVRIDQAKTNTIVGYSGGWNDRNFQFKINAGNELQIHITDGVASQIVSHSTTLTENQTYFVAVTYDGSDIALWVNNQENNFPVTTILDIDNDVFKIGGLSSGTDGFNGTIDELYVYREALNSTQIEEFLTEPLYSVGDEHIYYNLDESGGHGTTITDYGTLGFDAVTYQTVKSSDSKYLFARYLEGGTNAEVHTTTAPKLFSHDNESMTVCTWVKADNNSQGLGSSAIASQFDHGSGDRQWLLNENSLGQEVKFRVTYDGAQTQYKEIVSSLPVFDNQWHHVCGWWGSGDIRLYIDGFQDTAITTVRNDSFTATTGDDHELCIGCLYNNAIALNDLDGIVDDFRVFNRTLSHEEVYKLWANTRDNRFMHYEEGYYTSEGYCADTYDIDAYWNIWNVMVYDNTTGISGIDYRAGSSLPISSSWSTAVLGDDNYSFMEQEGMCLQVNISLSNPDVESDPIYYKNATYFSYKVYKPYLEDIDIFPDDITAPDTIYANATYFYNDSTPEDIGQIQYSWYINGVHDHTTLATSVDHNGSEVISAWSGSYIRGDVVYAGFQPGISTPYGTFWGDMYYSDNVTTENANYTFTYLPLYNISISKPERVLFSVDILDYDGDVNTTWTVNGINVINGTEFAFLSTEYASGTSYVITASMDDGDYESTVSWVVPVEQMENATLAMILAVGIIAGFLLFFAFKLDSDHFILKLFFIFAGLASLIFIPSVFIVGYENLTVAFLRLVTGIFLFFVLYIGTYIIYYWAKSSETFLRWLKGTKK